MAARFVVAVKPRSKRDAVEVDAAGAVIVRVRAPPVDGKANEAVVDVVAGALGVRRSEVRIVVGDSSRKKVVEVDGLTLDDVRARLQTPAGA